METSKGYLTFGQSVRKESWQSVRRKCESWKSPSFVTQCLWIRPASEFLVIILGVRNYFIHLLAGPSLDLWNTLLELTENWGWSVTILSSTHSILYLGPPRRRDCPVCHLQPSPGERRRDCSSDRLNRHAGGRGRGKAGPSRDSSNTTLREYTSQSTVFAIKM